MSLTFVNAEKHINDTIVFPAFDLSVKAGCITAIHSSVNVRAQLIDLLIGNTLLSNGNIQVGKDDIRNGIRNIGFLFLEDGLYDRLSVEEMLFFYKRLYDTDLLVNESMRKIQLDTKRKTKIGQLSYSEKKRVQFACLLLQNPDVYLLEEFDQNLDMESKKIVLLLLQQLRSEGKSIVMLTGNMESAVIAADEIYRLDDQGLHQVQLETDMEEEGMKDDVSKAADLVQPVRFEKIPTKVNEKIVLFDPPEIDYIESNDGQSFIHIKGESFVSPFTLKELEERLLPFGFFRSHRSYIVNLQKVREVITWTRNSFSLVLDDSEKSTIPLSKTKMAELKNMLGFK